MGGFEGVLTSHVMFSLETKGFHRHRFCGSSGDSRTRGSWERNQAENGVTGGLSEMTFGEIPGDCIRYYFIYFDIWVVFLAIERVSCVDFVDYVQRGVTVRSFKTCLKCRDGFYIYTPGLSNCLF